jgi:hypothetical protein
MSGLERKLRGNAEAAGVLGDGVSVLIESMKVQAIRVLVKAVKCL